MADKDFVVKNGLSVNGTLVYTGGILTLGNSTANITANSTQITLGSGLYINTSTYYVGNSTANVTVTIAGVVVSNGAGTTSISPTSVNTGSASLSNGVVTTPKVTTPNSSVDLTLGSGNTSAGSITIGANGATVIAGNSSVNAATITGDGVVINKSKIQNIAYSANVQWYLANGNIGILTLTGNTVMPSPIGLSPGNYILHVYNDVTGGRSITNWTNTVFKWTAGVAPTGSTNASAHDIYSFTCDGTYMYGSMVPDLR